MKFLILLFITVTLAHKFCEWEKCIGRETICWPCFDSPCSYNHNQNTFYRKLASLYFEVLTDVINKINITDLIFTQDVTTYVPYASIVISGLELNKNYLLIASPEITDLYGVYNVTILDSAQQNDVLFMTLIEHTFIPTENKNFDAEYNFKFSFINNQINEIYIYPINPQYINSQIPYQTDLNITSICNKIMTYCIESNQYYSSLQNCIDILNTKPLTFPNNPEIVGQFDTVACRSFHTKLAQIFYQQNPLQYDPHCLHASNLNEGSILTPCSIPV